VIDPQEFIPKAQSTIWEVVAQTQSGWKKAQIENNPRSNHSE